MQDCKVTRFSAMLRRSNIFLVAYMKVAFFDIKCQIVLYIQILTLHYGKQIANSKTDQILSLLSKFLFKKVALMCMLLHLSFKKIDRFVFK